MLGLSAMTNWMAPTTLPPTRQGRRQQLRRWEGQEVLQQAVQQQHAGQQVMQQNVLRLLLSQRNLPARMFNGKSLQPLHPLTPLVREAPGPQQGLLPAAFPPTWGAFAALQPVQINTLYHFYSLQGLPQKNVLRQYLRLP